MLFRSGALGGGSITFRVVLKLRKFGCESYSSDAVLG
jgi:hypothetical protein